MRDIWNLIRDHWTYLLTAGTVAAYLFEKGYSIWTDKKNKRQAYNRVFSAIIKLYYSYLKHRQIYSEQTPLNFPEEIYVTIAKHLNSFNNDLDEFKAEILKETEIIPEVTFQAQILFDTVDRMRAIDRIKLANDPNMEHLSDKDELVIKRAQFYSLDEVFEEFFTDIIEDVKKHTSVKSDFVNRLLSLNSPDYQKEAEEEQKKITKKYFESLNRQGLLPTDAYNALVQAMNL